MKNEIEDIVRDAGELLSQGFYAPQRFQEKDRGQLLSEYDILINRQLTSGLLRRFPDDSVFSEEAPETGKRDGAKWIVDPIDGSAYFIFGEPYFSISIAKELSGEIIEGHVYNPITNEYFYSDAYCKSSYLNGDKITVSKVTGIQDSLVAFGFSADIRKINRYYSHWPETFEKCKKGIAWICPALSICNVARGRLEAFIDSGCSYEGQAAASLILRHSGGAMFNYDDTEYDHRVKGGIFTNGHMEIEMSEERLE
jgi:myo-inositol-1(or 4)-monophosphatase